MELPDVIKSKIASTLGLRMEEDASLTESQLYSNYFKRASTLGILSEFANYINLEYNKLKGIKNEAG